VSSGAGIVFTLIVAGNWTRQAKEKIKRWLDEHLPDVINRYFERLRRVTRCW